MPPRRDRHDRERSGKKTPYPEATNPLLAPSQNAPGGDTLAGPAQGRAGPGRTVTATAEDPSA